ENRPLADRPREEARGEGPGPEPARQRREGQAPGRGERERDPGEAGVAHDRGHRIVSHSPAVIALGTAGRFDRTYEQTVPALTGPGRSENEPCSTCSRTSLPFVTASPGGSGSGWAACSG